MKLLTFSNSKRIITRIFCTKQRGKCTEFLVEMVYAFKKYRNFVARVDIGENLSPDAGKTGE